MHLARPLIVIFINFQLSLNINGEANGLKLFRSKMKFLCLFVNAEIIFFEIVNNDQLEL